MFCKLSIAFLLLFFSASIFAQGSLGVKFALGLSEHGYYNRFDEGGALPTANNRFSSGQLNLRTSNLQIGLSYHLDKIRIEADISVHSDIIISSSIFPSNYDWIRQGNTIRFNPIVGSLLFYGAKYRPKSRCTIQPGIGLGLSSFGINPKVNSGFGLTSPLSPFDLSFIYKDEIHNRFGYQLIGALELNMKAGSRHFLFVNAQYHFGLHKMFTREISYSLNQDQEFEFKALQVYDGSNSSLRCGLRVYFNDAHNYKMNE